MNGDRTIRARLRSQMSIAAMVRAAHIAFLSLTSVTQTCSVAQAHSALRLDAHQQHATKGYNNRRISIENVHDRVHVAVGGMVGSVSRAGFNPVFFLLHCNVDRIYESYLKDNEDSQREYERNQFIFSQRSGRDDVYKGALAPFKLKGKDFFPADTFNTVELG